VLGEQALVSMLVHAVLRSLTGHETDRDLPPLLGTTVVINQAPCPTHCLMTPIVLMIFVFHQQRCTDIKIHSTDRVTRLQTLCGAVQMFD